MGLNCSFFYDNGACEGSGSTATNWFIQKFFNVNLTIRVCQISLLLGHLCPSAKSALSLRIYCWPDSEVTVPPLIPAHSWPFPAPPVHFDPNEGVQIVRCHWRIARIYRVWVQLTGFAGSRDAVDSLPNSCRCRSEPVCRMCWLTLFSAANDAVLSRKNKSAVSRWLWKSNNKHMVVTGPLK